MRRVIAEMEELYTEIVETMKSVALCILLGWQVGSWIPLLCRDEASEVTDHAIACGLLVQHETVLRDKRCLLAYLSVPLLVLVVVKWHASPTMGLLLEQGAPLVTHPGFAVGDRHCIARTHQGAAQCQRN